MHLCMLGAQPVWKKHQTFVTHSTDMQFAYHHETKTGIGPSPIFPVSLSLPDMETVHWVCASVCVLCVMTHLALLVQRFDGKCVGSYVNDHAQLEPVVEVWRPHWPPILHVLSPVRATKQLRQREAGMENI